MVNKCPAAFSSTLREGSYVKGFVVATGHFGDWQKNYVMCAGANGGYLPVVGFSFRLEAYQGTDRDDTALNGIKLKCQDGKIITVSEGMWGDWYPRSPEGRGVTYDCPQGQIANQVWAKIDKQRGSGFSTSILASDALGNDDVGAVGLNLWCDKGGYAVTDFDTLASSLTGQDVWVGIGTWATTTCEPGTWLCGMAVRTEANQGSSNDDSALNGISMACCKYPSPSSPPPPPVKPPPPPVALREGSYTNGVLATEGHFGNWQQNFVMCTGAKGGYLPVVGYAMRVEAYQGTSKDDTALNGIKLKCQDGKIITVSEGIWGDWYPRSPAGKTETFDCPSGQYVDAINVKLDERRGSGFSTSIFASDALGNDDVGAVGFELYCNKGDRAGIYSFNDMANAATGQDVWADIGYWQGRASCGSGKFVCGMAVRTEANQGSDSDDSALNGIELACCAF
ncbi:hypothetical protein HYH03_005079 [Edaphochlamys debaryana]|uniref:Uncharacterized protein n=1 Tax=Edaphochlamys debaryana TaxID=47281 RepID=A0A835Y6G6_9CHLO|nr:hypothetical protein HYH03_005079 [Edaphochlamys debaryana]|eukprot:KAG2497085.1 hypothetical protein HYH03_005079 [Edaphochlamys debaryana]